MNIKENVKKHKLISSFLIHIYLNMLFFYNFFKSIIVDWLIAILRRFVVRKDITSLTITTNEVTLRFYGKSFFWNPHDTNSLLGIGYIGEYEKKEMSGILPYLKKNMVVFDIGANFGLHSTVFADRVGPKGHVYSFEPNISVYRELNKNIRLNGFTSRITTENMGLSNKPGVMTLYLTPVLGSGASSLRKRWNGLNHIQKCSLSTLDLYVKSNNVPRVNFIKCDVEGAELEVFQGAENTLKIQKPILVFECIDNHTAVFGYTVKNLIEYIRSLSYTVYLLDQTKLRKVKDQYFNGNFIAFPVKK